MAPGLTGEPLLELILVDVDLVLDYGEEPVLIDEAPHILQLLLDLEVALLEEFGLEVDEDGEACLKDKDLAVENYVIPDAASDFEVNILDEDSDKPVRQE